MRIEAADPSDFGWIIHRTGCALTQSARGIRAVDDSGLVRGMIAYDMWTENACQAHMAADTWVAWRSMLGPAFSYPFEECGKGVILVAVTGDNAKSLALVRNFGFEPLATVQDGWAKGVPLHTFQMRKENCRFLAKKAA